MSLDIDDTIVALASAPGGSYEGIVRLSGPAVVAILGSVWEAGQGGGGAGREARGIRSKSPSVFSGQLRVQTESRGEVLLPAMIYLWPTSRSYTRQPLAEIYLPGSPPLLDLAIRTICQCGARLARPGEFTLRAFLAGRLDLTQAEAVLGVIEARDAAELQTALSQLAGGLSSKLTDLRNQLLDLLAHLEAGLDFVEEDIEFITRADLQSQVAAAATTVQTIADQLQSRGEVSSTVPRVVLLGEPNAGKSSLLNALAGSATALVSPAAGTTRDYLVRMLNLGDLKIQLIDTAGVDDFASQDAIAADAQSLGRDQHQQADLQLLCIDASQPMSPWSQSHLAIPSTIPRLIVHTKCDLADDFKFDGLSYKSSATTGQGLGELRAAIVSALREPATETRAITSTAVRCSASLQAAAATLAAAAELAASGASEEWIAAELRLALDDLGQVVGAVYTDDILDRVFSRFCIGK